MNKKIHHWLNYALCVAVGYATPAMAGKTNKQSTSKKPSSLKEDGLPAKKRLVKKVRKLTKREKHDVFSGTSKKNINAFQIQRVFEKTYGGNSEEVFSSGVDKEKELKKETNKFDQSQWAIESLVHENFTQKNEEEVVAFLEKKNFVCSFCGKDLKGFTTRDLLCEPHVKVQCFMCGEFVITCLNNENPHECKEDQRLCFMCNGAGNFISQEHKLECKINCFYCGKPIYTNNPNLLQDHFLGIDEEGNPVCPESASQMNVNSAILQLVKIRDILKYRSRWCPWCKSLCHCGDNHTINKQHCKTCGFYGPKCAIEKLHNKCGQMLQCQECKNLIPYESAEEHLTKHPKAWAGQTTAEAKKNPNFLQRVCAVCRRVIHLKGIEFCPACKQFMDEKGKIYSDGMCTVECCSQCHAGAIKKHLEGCELCFECPTCLLWFKPYTLREEHERTHQPLDTL